MMKSFVVNWLCQWNFDWLLVLTPPCCSCEFRYIWFLPDLYQAASEIHDVVSCCVVLCCLVLRCVVASRACSHPYFDLVHTNCIYYDATCHALLAVLKVCCVTQLYKMPPPPQQHDAPPVGSAVQPNVRTCACVGTSWRVGRAKKA